MSRGEDGTQVRSRTKTNKPRTTAVSRLTLDELARHRERIEALLADVGAEPSVVDPDGIVFSGGDGSRRRPLDGQPWQPNSATRRFRLLKERAGVRPDIDLHGLRHTMITEMLAAGVDPRTDMGRAGHTTEATTMQVYAKVRPAIDAAAAEMWSQVLSTKLQELRTQQAPAKKSG